MRIFKEQQRFTQSWLIVIMILSILIPIGLITKEYTSENSTMPTKEFLAILGLILAACLPIFLFQLKTRIDEKGIHYQFFPVHRKFKSIPWNDILSAYVRTYDPIGEYGGWGFKGGFMKKRGKAINIKGNIGIQLELKNSKKLLIGTQLESEAKRVLETYAHKVANKES